MDDRDAGGSSVMGPIFLGGASRSGKTLMRWMLSSHSRIVVTRRTEMWPRFYARFGDLRRPENFERCLGAMLARAHIASLATDPDRLRRDFWRGPPSYGRLFALVHEQFARRCGKARWGDQTPLVERFTGELVSAYEGTRVIHLIRDPRDRYEAILERGRQGPFCVQRSMTNWLVSAALAARNAHRYPGAYKVVRYETLARRPEETMRDVCAFVEEDFEPGMLDVEGTRRYQGERAASSTGSAISTAYIGRYRDGLDCRELACIQSLAGRQLLAFGYRPEPIQLTSGDRIRFATIDWPVGLALASSTRAQAALHHRPSARIRNLVAGK
jgi:Sulfotransferase family